MSDVGVLHGDILLYYQDRVDYASSTVIYYGWAAPGTAETTVKWQIVRETLDSSQRHTKKEFAQGSIDFTSAWSLLATYTYS